MPRRFTIRWSATRVMSALRAAALRFWISRLFDLHRPRDGELVNAYNPDQFKHILQQHIAANGDAITLM